MKKITSAFLFVILGAFSLVANASAYSADLANEAVVGAQSWKALW